MRRLLSLALIALSSTQAVHASINARATASIPQYVLEYGNSFTQYTKAKRLYAYPNSTAPLVWLHSQETYMPSDIQQQLDHTKPKVNWTVVAGAQSPLDLDNLDSLNSLGNTSVYLTSSEGIDASPEPAWFRGIIPDLEGRIGDGTGSAIVVVNRGNGTVDAFYFYFYA
jgi:hypothetical protein